MEIAGAIDSTYFIATVDSADAGVYICAITNTIVDGLTLYSRPFTVSVEGFTGTGAHTKSLPHGFMLYQNYPNPFNPLTTIGYRIARSGHVKIYVYSTDGRLVSRLMDNHVPPGDYTLT